MSLQTDLFAHQEKAVIKMLPSRLGALFMDMGTGKTRVTIELAHLRKAKINRVLWFCPVSLKDTIRKEVEKHARWDVWVHNQDRPGEYGFINVFGIESMSSSTNCVLAVADLIDDKTMVVVDESTFIKGHKSLRTKRITALSEKARYRLLLTGTPITQGVEDLFAQMRFLSPKILGYKSFYSFARGHLVYSDKYPGMVVETKNEEYLAQRIAPYVYQVKKEECLSLPPKLSKKLYFGMTPEQREAYERAKYEILANCDEIDSYVIFKLFSILQQIVSGFWNDKEAEKFHQFSHGRLDMLETAIKGIPAGEKVIIWCKFRRSIEAVKEMLEAKGEQVALFYGDISERERANELELKFRQNARFLVATAASGGHGLTLNEAAWGIFYENEFKYSNRIQAEDRQHRIGQSRPVTYIDIVCHSSIDERIEKAIASKANGLELFREEIEQVKSLYTHEQLVKKLMVEL